MKSDRNLWCAIACLFPVIPMTYWEVLHYWPVRLADRNPWHASAYLFLSYPWHPTSPSLCVAHWHWLVANSHRTTCYHCHNNDIAALWVWSAPSYVNTRRDIYVTICPTGPAYQHVYHLSFIWHTTITHCITGINGALCNIVYLVQSILVSMKQPFLILALYVDSAMHARL